MYQEIHDPVRGVLRRGDYRWQTGTPIPPGGKIIDLNTGLEIRFVFRFDEITGEWSAYQADKDRILQYESGAPKTHHGQGPIKFIPRE